MRRWLARNSLRLLRGERWRALQDLLASQSLSPTELIVLQQHKMLGLLRHAAERVPFYRRFCEEMGLAPERLDPDDLFRLPLVHKESIVAKPEDFQAQGVDPGDRIANSTGGSTGVMLHFYGDRRCGASRQASDLRGRMWVGWDVGDRMAMLWGHQGDIAARERLRQRLSNALFSPMILLDAHGMDESSILRYRERFVRFRPRLIIGYASAMAFLAEYLGQRGLSVPPPVAIISSAESLTSEQRSVIEEYFGCAVYDRYGSREFSCIAQQCEQSGGLHVSAERLLVEVLDHEGQPCVPGETGEIVITDLENRVMPFIRYRTGDLAVPATAPCACGVGLPLLARVEGRAADLLVALDGRIVTNLGPRLFGHGIAGLKQMQVVQEALTHIRVKVVPTAEWCEAAEKSVQKRVREHLGDVEVTVQLVDRILPSSSGKYRFTISKVSPFDPRMPT